MHIKRFDLTTMCPNPSILIIGNHDAMKNKIVQDIMFHYKNIPGGLIISPNKTTNDFYRNFFPDIYIHEEMNEEIINKTLYRQHIIIEKSKTNENINPSESINSENSKSGKNIDPSALIVMDNCLSQMKLWSKNQSILEILMNGRHYRLTNILTMQTPLGIKLDLRLNFDYIFLLKEDFTINKKKLWENYASVFPSFATFQEFFDNCTGGYQSVMVIDNRKTTDNIPDKVFWFQPRMNLIEFGFGCQQFRKIHDMFYKNDCNLDAKIYLNEFNSYDSCDYHFDYFINATKFRNNVSISNKIDNSQQNKNDIQQNKDDTDYIYNFYLDGDDSSKIKDSVTSDNVLKSNDLDVNTQDYIKISYKDDNYQLSVLLTKFENPEYIKTLCGHILRLKTSIGKH